MRNLELKSRYHNVEKLRNLAREIGAEYQKTMRQTDTYFAVKDRFASPLRSEPKGRLKLRETDGEPAQLVYYEREDKQASSHSNYLICEISNPVDFKKVMIAAFGLKVEVIKSRELWMFRSTRIHIDEVNGLGHFVELETVIDKQTDKEAQKEHQFVKEKLEIDDAKLIAFSYGDMIPRI